MLLYPQLTSGAMVQYPLTKQCHSRLSESRMEDGSIVRNYDLRANYLGWRMHYRDLSDPEARALEEFFVAAQGRLTSFLFLDPTSNLLTWTDDFSQPDWQTTGLTFDTGVGNPFGTSGATRIHATPGSDRTLRQLTQIPGSAQTCFSVYLRADVPAAVTLARSVSTARVNAVVNVTRVWQRYSTTGYFTGIGEASVFEMTVPGGSAIEVYGPQVDAQTNPSKYVASLARGGVYPDTRFDMTQMEVHVTGPNRSACVVNIRCNLPLGD